MTNKLLGQLQVAPINGRNIPQRSTLGKQSPFVEFSIGDNVQRTNICKKGGRNPNWKDVLTFDIYEDTTSLKMRCLLEKGTSPYEYLGSCLIDLKTVFELKEYDNWYVITDRNEDVGDIYVELTYFADGEPRPTKIADKKPTYVEEGTSLLSLRDLSMGSDSRSFSSTKDFISDSNKDEINSILSEISAIVDLPAKTPPSPQAAKTCTNNSLNITFDNEGEQKLNEPNKNECLNNYSKESSTKEVKQDLYKTPESENQSTYNSINSTPISMALDYSEDLTETNALGIIGATAQALNSDKDGSPSPAGTRAMKKLPPLPPKRDSTCDRRKSLQLTPHTMILENKKSLSQNNSPSLSSNNNSYLGTPENTPSIPTKKYANNSRLSSPAMVEAKLNDQTLSSNLKFHNLDYSNSPKTKPMVMSTPNKPSPLAKPLEIESSPEDRRKQRRRSVLPNIPSPNLNKMKKIEPSPKHRHPLPELYNSPNIVFVKDPPGTPPTRKILVMTESPPSPQTLAQKLDEHETSPPINTMQNVCSPNVYSKCSPAINAKSPRLRKIT